MPYIVIWSSRALKDLQRMYDFLSEKSEDAAIEAFKTINQAALLLEDYPSAGCPANDLDPEHRELVIPLGGSGYVFIYEVHGKQVAILALKHQREVGY